MDQLYNSLHSKSSLSKICLQHVLPTVSFNIKNIEKIEIYWRNEDTIKSQQKPLSITFFFFFFWQKHLSMYSKRGFLVLYLTLDFKLKIIHHQPTCLLFSHDTYLKHVHKINEDKWIFLNLLLLKKINSTLYIFLFIYLPSYNNKDNHLTFFCN